MPTLSYANIIEITDQGADTIGFLEPSDGVLALFAARELVCLAVR
jgi:hypothetical protein